MKIIGSRKSLLFKTAGVGFVITAISFTLLYINDYNTGQEIRRMVKSEGMAYFNSIQETGLQLSKNTVAYSAAIFKSQYDQGCTLALSVIRRELDHNGSGDVLVWYLSHDGNIISESGNISPGLLNKCLRFCESGRSDGNIASGDQIFMIIRHRFIENGRESLIMLFPLEHLYATEDRNKRIRVSTALKSDSTIFAFSIPIEEFDGKQAGFFEIKPKMGMPRESDLSGWVVIVLGLLPLLGFILISYLLYRYFESFANHSAIIRRILKREKPGVEIFRRDQEIVKNEMPDLSEIFSLIDESISEKNKFKRSLDIVSAALGVIQEKGYDPATAAEIIELIVNTANLFGGAIFSLEHSDERVEVIGKYNFNEVLLTGLSQTAAGLSFIKHIQKQGTNLVFSGDELTEEQWRKLFEGFQHVQAIPLLFKARFEGLLVLTSLDSISESNMPAIVSIILSELLGNLVHGLGIEREKLARYDKTMILQETSLAISSKLDLPSVLQVVASRLNDYANATYCLILLNTDFENVMEVASFHTRRQQGIHIPESARLNIAELPKVAEAMITKRTLILGPQELSELSAAEKRFFRTESVKLLTILPISHSAKTIGAVVLGEERSKSRAAVAPDKLSFVQAIVSQAASAIENARLYGFINNKVDQLTTLYNAGAAIHSEINTGAMLDKVLNAIREYLKYSIAAVFTPDEKSNCLRPAVMISAEIQQGTERIACGAANSVVEKTASSGQSQLIEDFRVETNIKSSFPRLMSELSVPIKLGGRTLGVLMVGSRVKQAFSEVHENFLRTLAAQIAVAMERTRLFEQECKRGVKLTTIFEFSKNLSRSLNVQEVIKIAADSIREAFNYQLVAVFLLDQAKKRYSMEYQASSSDKKLPEDFAVAENCGLLGAAINSRKTIYSSNVSSEPDYVIGIEDVKSEVCIPIIVGDKIRGILDVESMDFEGFTSEDISTLEALADIMAVAIDNSVLFEESIQKAERLSLIDNINKAISATLDLDSFFRVVARAVSDNAGYRWTCLVVPDGDSFIFKAGYTPVSAGAISTESILQMIQKKLALVIQHSMPEFITLSQLADLGSPEKLQSVVDAGIRNLALFPIGDNTRAEAVMIVGSSHSDGFSPQELQLIKDLAVHLRIAWQNAQLYKKLKTAYEQLQEAQDRIIQTEKLRALGEMSSGVVHDFNNVLAAILGRLQIVNGKLDDYEDWSGRPFLERNLDLIEKAASDGSHILSRIREFTKKKPSEKFAEIQVDQIINDTIELTRPRWHDHALAKGKSIDLEFKREGNLQTTGSPSELREVFINLINNAVDAMEGDGKITVDARLASEKQIKITLEDNGSGMSPETRKRIFEPFFTTKGARGTGLGLSVTYGIITRHKGTIDVESELGRGTRFTIILPVREGDQDQTKTIEVQAGESRSILVVDDEEGFREVLVEILASGGHRADSVADAQAALDKMEYNNYDLVITDLGMSGLSGWELADMLHKLHSEVRVIMATGWGADLDRENLRAHHVNSLIGKPFKIDEILKAVNEVLTRSRDEVFVDQD